MGRPLKTHCIKGHEFTPENTLLRPNGQRRCRACRKAQDALDQERRMGRAPKPEGHPNSRKTECINGHPFTPENTRIDSLGRRICRTCKREHYTPHRKTLQERLWEKIAVAGPDECWLWTGARTVARPQWPEDHRYGVISEGPRGSAKMLKVHRVAWESVNGPIPKGMTIDHLCRVKLCCNPAHLEPVTASENTKRQWRHRRRARRAST